MERGTPMDTLGTLVDPWRYDPVWDEAEEGLTGLVAPEDEEGVKALRGERGEEEAETEGETAEEGDEAAGLALAAAAEALGDL